MKPATITYEALPASVNTVVERYVPSFLPNNDARQLEVHLQFLVTAAGKAYAAKHNVGLARQRLQYKEQYSDQHRIPSAQYHRVAYYAACWAAAKITYERYYKELKEAHKWWQVASRNFQASGGAYKTDEEKELYLYNLLVMYELIVTCVTEDLEGIYDDLHRIPSHKAALTQRQLATGLLIDWAKTDKKYISPAT